MEKSITIYLNTIRLLCPKISEVELEYFSNELIVEKLSSKHFYIQANVIQSNIGFVVSGLLRAFYIDRNGNDITVEFLNEGKYATHYPALIRNIPAKYYFQCIEPSTIINIPYSHLLDCCDKHPVFERYVRLLVEEAFYLQQRRIEGFIFENAETRYLNFIQDNPGVFNRISLSHLCSYLGIERQTLTRIRKKLIS